MPRIVQLLPSGIGNSIGFTTEPGQTYNAECSEQLENASWSVFGNEVTGDGTTNMVMDPGGGKLPMRFYRVSSRIPPWDAVGQDIP